MPAVDFDIREELTLHVGREGTIHYESNHYTVPATHIGEFVSLFVHLLHRGVELNLPDRTSRTFTLAVAGSHGRIDFLGDCVSQPKRWEGDRERIVVVAKHAVVTPAATGDVALRSTSLHTLPDAKWLYENIRYGTKVVIGP